MDELDQEIFTNRDEFAPGGVSYDVEQSWRGMMAMRELIDRHWGRKWNYSMMAQRANRRDGFDPYMLSSYRDRWTLGIANGVIFRGGRLAGLVEGDSGGVYSKETETEFFREFLRRRNRRPRRKADFDRRRDEMLLFGGTDWRVRRSAVCRLSASGIGCRAVVAAVNDPSPEVRLMCAVSYRWDFSRLYEDTTIDWMEELMEKLCHDENDVVRSAFAMRCPKDSRLLDWMIEHGSRNVRRYVAYRRDLDQETAGRLACKCAAEETRTRLTIMALAGLAGLDHAGIDGEGAVCR